MAGLRLTTRANAAARIRIGFVAFIAFVTFIGGLAAWEGARRLAQAQQLASITATSDQLVSVAVNWQEKYNDDLQYNVFAWRKALTTLDDHIAVANSVAGPFIQAPIPDGAALRETRTKAGTPVSLLDPSRGGLELLVVRDIYTGATQILRIQGNKVTLLQPSILPAEAPGPVQDLQAQKTSSGIAVTWQPSLRDGGNPIQGYEVSYRIDQSSWQVLTETNVLDQYALITDPQDGTYQIRVVATNGDHVSPAATTTISLP